jgi:hypothetical protein
MYKNKKCKSSRFSSEEDTLALDFNIYLEKYDRYIGYPFGIKKDSPGIPSLFLKGFISEFFAYSLRKKKFLIIVGSMSQYIFFSRNPFKKG